MTECVYDPVIHAVKHMNIVMWREAALLSSSVSVRRSKYNVEKM